VNRVEVLHWMIAKYGIGAQLPLPSEIPEGDWTVTQQWWDPNVVKVFALRRCDGAEYHVGIRPSLAHCEETRPAPLS
jgi:hypothetical protein